MSLQAAPPWVAQRCPYRFTGHNEATGKRQVNLCAPASEAEPYPAKPTFRGPTIAKLPPVSLGGAMDCPAPTRVELRPPITLDSDGEMGRPPFGPD